MRRLLLALAVLAAALPATPEAPTSWFFAVLSDPQFGMYAKDQNFAQETSNFGFAIANLNRLHPRFVVICGDLVNRTGDPDEIAEYKRILKQLDPSIPVYSVAGNHDVGNLPTTPTVERFRAEFGRDYYTFSAGEVFGIVLDSSLIGSPGGDPMAATEQEAWLEKTLANAKLGSNQQIVVFQHIPYFIENPNEADGYFNIAQPTRRKYLDLLERAGVSYVFAGHYHRNAIGVDGPLKEIVTGAVGMPLGKSQSGFRIVTVDGQNLNSTWVCFGDIPNQVDSHKPATTSCPQ